MNPPEENVLVIKRALFDQLGSFQGLNFEPRKYLDAILSRGNNFFLRRAVAENDPSHKGRPWSSKHLRECYSQAAERFGWSKRSAQPGQHVDDTAGRPGVTGTHGHTASIALLTGPKISGRWGRPQHHGC